MDVDAFDRGIVEDKRFVDLDIELFDKPMSTHDERAAPAAVFSDGKEVTILHHGKFHTDGAPLSVVQQRDRRRLGKDAPGTLVHRDLAPLVYRNINPPPPLRPRLSFSSFCDLPRHRQ